MFKIISKSNYEDLLKEWELQNAKIDRLTASTNKYKNLYEEVCKQKENIEVVLTKANFEIKDLKKQIKKLKEQINEEVI